MNQHRSYNKNYNNKQGRGDGKKGGAALSIAADQSAELRASSLPPLEASSAPALRTASLCSSSSTSELYVSPCDSIRESGPDQHGEHQSPATQNNELHKSKEQRRMSGEGQESASAAPPPGMQSSSFAAPTAAHAVAGSHGASSLSHFSNSPPPSTSAAPPLPRTHFQYIHSFEYRSRLAAKMRHLYGPETIPVVVEPAESHVRVASPPSHVYGSHRGRSDVYGSGGGVQRRGESYGGANGDRRADARVSASPPLSSAAVAALSSPSTKSTIKCVLPASKSVAEIILTLRDRLALDSCQSIFLSVGDSDALVPGNSLLGDLYERYRNQDGFLYLSYLLENTFG